MNADQGQRLTTPAPATPTTGLASLATLWTLPFTMAAAWTHAWFSIVRPGEPEIDRGDGSAQLPIPNALQRAKDKDLFA